jgi:hypothetical protein
LQRHAVEALAASAAALLVTLVIAAPVVRAPSERIFGAEIVGRHHDPFTVMQQFARPLWPTTLGVYSQPVTDLTGGAIARVAGAVAAYNWLVLLSFPLSAAAAYLLARHLALPPAGAMLAALLFAFSPFHLAHAAYHPHIAQTQWLPLYLLALWRCLDEATWFAVTFLIVATVAVTLSNFYGGLIAAVITPIAIGAYWLARARFAPHAPRRLGITVGTLAGLALAGLAFVLWIAPGVVGDRTAWAFPRADLFRYSATWWGYLVPPVAHPLLGGLARRIWIASKVNEGLLEQQVSLGWSVIALGLIAMYGWRATDRRSTAEASVPILAAVALVALVCSLSPERTIGGVTVARPSALLYAIVPMFRSYARFGVIVQLMAAILAGIGVDQLRRAGTQRARIVCVVLVALAAGEYAVSPSALWRDVLPTPAHRWVVQQGDRVRAVDCTPLNPESESVQWLTGSRVMLLGGSIGDCTDPNLSRKLAANGYTHLLVRRDTAGGQWLADHPAPDGLRVAARFDDGQVFAVTAQRPAIYTATMTGFFPREHDAVWAWRWMGANATWTIVNSNARPMVATLGLEMSAFAFHRARHMEVRLDGHSVQTLAVEPSRRIYQIGPLTVSPGDHELVFHSAEAPAVAGDVINNGDRRPLSFALGTWTWRVRDEQP